MNTLNLNVKIHITEILYSRSFWLDISPSRLWLQKQEQEGAIPTAKNIPHPPPFLLEDLVLAGGVDVEIPSKS